jgi:hypothetical protein
MAVKRIRSLTDLDQPEAVRFANKLVGEVLKPLTRRIPPELLGERHRARLVGQALGERLLASVGYLVEEARAHVLEALNFGYPSHTFPLRHDELRSLGLKAELATGETAEALAGLYRLATREEDLVKLVHPATASQLHGTAATGDVAA